MIWIWLHDIYINGLSCLMLWSCLHWLECTDHDHHEFQDLSGERRERDIEILFVFSILTIVYFTWVSIRKARCLLGIRAPSLLEKISARLSPDLPPFLPGVKLAIRTFPIPFMMGPPFPVLPLITPFSFWNLRNKTWWPAGLKIKLQIDLRRFPMNFPINTTARTINNASTALSSDMMVIRNGNTHQLSSAQLVSSQHCCSVN